MKITRKKSKARNVTLGKQPPAVGFQVMPSQASPFTNTASMRPTYSFLPYDQDLVNQRNFQDKLNWLKNNPGKQEKDYPGPPDLWGRPTQAQVDQSDPNWLRAFQRFYTSEVVLER
jgi:hypothetical protein